MESCELLERYKSKLLKDQLSQNTVKAYYFAAYTFLNLYNKITAENVISFQYYLIENYSPKSVNLQIVAFNRFLTYAGKADYRLKPVKCRQANYLDNVISYDEYLFFKKNLQLKENRKWYFIVWVLASTGVRISELIQFRVDDIKKGYLDVHAKGNKVRRVFIPKKTTERNFHMGFWTETWNRTHLQEQTWSSNINQRNNQRIGARSKKSGTWSAFGSSPRFPTSLCKKVSWEERRRSNARRFVRTRKSWYDKDLPAQDLSWTTVDHR